MRKVAFAVQFPVVCQKKAITENVVCGGEQAACRFGKALNPIAERFRQETDVAPGVTIFVIEAIQKTLSSLIGFTVSTLAWPRRFRW